MRIYDTFPFDGELDLLEHRLREMYELVDVFILVEAGETYQGRRKPCVFEANKQRFAWADSKLRHVKLSTLGEPARSPRSRAALQRDASMLAMRDLQPDDVVLLLDVDEVPSRAVLRLIRMTPPTLPTRLLMTRHYQYIEMIGPASACCPDVRDAFAVAKPRLIPDRWDELGDRWFGESGVAVPAALLLGDQVAGINAATPFQLRFARPQARLHHAGRHLSSVDPSTRLNDKLARVFHVEWATSRALQPLNLARCREHGVHHRGWWYAESPHGPLPDDLARLRQHCATLARNASLPRLWRRQLVRTWAWLRLWPRWPEAFVRQVDLAFDRWLPLIAVPLMAAGLLRRCRAFALRHRSLVAPLTDGQGRSH